VPEATLVAAEPVREPSTVNQSAETQQQPDARTTDEDRTNISFGLMYALI
jgi:hypothetical protein